MFDKNLFKYFIARANKTFGSTAAFLGINEATLYRKSNGISDFTREEIQQLKRFLGLTDQEAMQVFFAEKLTETQVSDATEE